MSTSQGADREGAGIVDPASLAAESLQANGDFAQNHNIRDPNSNPHPNDIASTKPSQTPADVAATATENKGADTAPSYVNASAAVGDGKADGAKPHGKNVVEDPEMIGRPAKFSVDGVGAGDVGARGPVAGGGAAGGGDARRGGVFDTLGRDAEA